MPNFSIATSRKKKLILIDVRGIQGYEEIFRCQLMLQGDNVKQKKDSKLKISHQRRDVISGRKFKKMVVDYGALLTASGRKTGEKIARIIQERGRPYWMTILHW